MAATNGFEAKMALRAGAAAGAIGGAVLSLFIAAMCAIKGLDIWSMTFKGAAAPFLGEAAMRPGFDLVPVALGIACHFALSIGWGLLFGLVVYGMSKPVTLVMSALWGLVVWVGMFYAVLPLVGLGEMARQASVASGIMTHLVFGIAMGAAFLPLQHPRHSHVRRHLPIHGH